MQFTFRWTITEPGGTQHVYEKSYTGDGEINVEVSIPVGTDAEVAIAIDVSQVKAIEIVADGALTIETNSGSAPDDTLVLVANVPYQWCTDSLDSFLLTTDITTNIFVTNASGASRTLKIKGVYDASLP